MSLLALMDGTVGAADSMLEQLSNVAAWVGAASTLKTDTARTRESKNPLAVRVRNGKSSGETRNGSEPRGRPEFHEGIVSMQRMRGFYKRAQPRAFRSAANTASISASDV